MRARESAKAEPVARLTLLGEVESYGAQSSPSPSERWQLHAGQQYWLEIGRFRPASGDSLPVYQATSLPFALHPEAPPDDVQAPPVWFVAPALVLVGLTVGLGVATAVFDLASERTVAVEVVARDVAAYQALIDEILERRIGVKRYFTFVVTKPVKSAAPPLALLRANGADES